jgi:NADH-quinone oxidoreductase subunit E
MSTTHDARVEMDRIDEVIERWGRDPEFVIEMMQDLQKTFRHVPRPALERMAEVTGADLARLHHVATFYKAFSLEPRGEVAVQVCTGTACHVRGAARVLEAFSRELDVAPGGTTADMRFTLEGVRCLGCCTLAPVVTIGGDVHGQLDSSKVGKALRKVRTRSDATQEERDA